MTKSYVIDPETGKLLTAQEWKEKAGADVKQADFVAIVPADGSAPFMFPKNHLGEMAWQKAMEAAEFFQGVTPEFTLGDWQLPTRKQGIDIRDARSAGLDQLMNLIGGDNLDDYYWTRELWIARGTSEEECRKIEESWSSSRSSATYAWSFNGYYGYASGGNLYTANRALPVLLLDPVCVPEDADA